MLPRPPPISAPSNRHRLSSRAQARHQRALPSRSWSEGRLCIPKNVGNPAGLRGPRRETLPKERHVVVEADVLVQPRADNHPALSRGNQDDSVTRPEACVGRGRSFLRHDRGPYLSAGCSGPNRIRRPYSPRVSSSPTSRASSQSCVPRHHRTSGGGNPVRHIARCVAKSTTAWNAP